MSDAPRRLLVPVSTAPAIVDGFRPGRDRCRILVATADTVVRGERGTDGVVLRLTGAGFDRTVLFPGLDALPLDDVLLEVEGDRASRVRLRALVDAAPAPRRRRPTTQFVVRPGQPLPTFDAFAPGRQKIEIGIEKDQAPDVAVTPTRDGRDGLVLIDGRPAAILAGAPDATPDDLQFVPRWGTTPGRD